MKTKDNKIIINNNKSNYFVHESFRAIIVQHRINSVACEHSTARLLICITS